MAGSADPIRMNVEAVFLLRFPILRSGTMPATPLRYRGITYRTSPRGLPSSKPVDHVYRGIHYATSATQETAPVDETLTFRYRGVPYHHEVVAANHLSSR